jgi:hypothetical protein
MRFGMIYVDGVGRGTGGTRYQKDSARWFSQRAVSRLQPIPQDYLSCNSAATVAAANPIGSAYSGPAVTPTQAPTILMILSDDLGWADVGWHQRLKCNSEVVTPHMDRLTAQGVELDRHYAFKSV